MREHERKADSAIHADEIFGRGSKPMLAAVKAARQVIAGDTPDDELRDTDTALAASCALALAEHLQFDHQRRSWIVCDSRSSVWSPDVSGVARRMLQGWAEDHAFAKIAEAATRRDMAAVQTALRRSLSARGMRDLLELASYQAPLASAGTEWDANPDVLGTVGGQFIDLKTGGVRPLTPADRVMRAAAVPVDPAARCDRWRRFVPEIMDDDPGLIGLLRAALGYSLTGQIPEQVFFVTIGQGANAKSTLLELLAYVLGPLAGVLPFAVLTRDRDNRAVQAEIADLPGARFVRASEVREGVHLDEGRIKALTGGDVINAARKFGHPFSFHPQFKLWLSVNTRPRVSDRSHGFWRRAMLIPFRRTFAVDKRLAHQLRDEAPGILAWLVEAAGEWYQTGLPRTEAAEAARNDWRDAEDVIGQWAACALVDAPDGRLGGAVAFEAFKAWAAAEGLSDRERPGARTFGEWMGARFQSRRGSGGKSYSARLLTGDGSEGSSGKVSSMRAHEDSFPNKHHNPSPDTNGGERVRI